MSDSLNFYSETCQTMVSMVLSCARRCHRKFLLKSTRNNWIIIAHIFVCVYMHYLVLLSLSLLLSSYLCSYTLYYNNDKHMRKGTNSTCIWYVHQIQKSTNITIIFNIVFRPDNRAIADYEYVETHTHPVSNIENKNSMVRGNPARQE